MLFAEDFGVDERASALLKELPEEAQQEVLQKLSEGLEAGKVRNASAYVVGSVHSPATMGIDERALKLLQELPKAEQKTMMDKLRNTPNVQNPSAWVAKAVMSHPQRSGPWPMSTPQVVMPPQQQQHLLPLRTWMPMPVQQHAWPQQQVWAPSGHGALDERAKALLNSLPIASREEILSLLRQQNGVRNPSAWVAKAAMAAGATPLSGAVAPQAGAAPAAGGGSKLDSKAQSLLDQLPMPAQQEILEKLRQETGVRNPSAWVAKAALKAGAAPAVGGDSKLDSMAQSLLDQLPMPAQQEILEKLHQEAGVRNPSAWVAKAALKAGAVPQQNAGFVPKLDSGAQALLDELPEATQTEIMGKLKETMEQGNVQNPSAWVAKAALRARDPGPAGPIRPTNKGNHSKPY